MKERLKELLELLERLKTKKSTIQVEKAILEKGKLELKEELDKLNIKPEDLDKLIVELETKIDEELNSLNIPKELEDL